MSKDARSPITPRLPRGLVDHGAGELAVRDAMLAKIRAVYERYGFDPVETPMIEYTDALGKFLPDQDRPNEGVFSFQDDDEQWMSLRYDLTAPLARYVAEHFDQLPKPYRSYRVGTVFRNEKPGPGRFRQFMQFDADTVGAASVAADAEICMMAADAMEALGISRGDYVIRVNNRKVLDGVMEAIGLGGDDKAGQRLTVLRAIDKLDRLGVDGVRQLLGEGRRDESGDRTPGARLSEEQSEFVLGLLRGDRFVEGHTEVAFEKAVQANQTWESGFKELDQIHSLVRASGYGADRIRIDPSVVRGLEYYTGPVFEAELLFETVNEKGEKARFGSVGGGGRYDGLVGRFRRENVPATGFSIGVSRLQAALAALGKLDAGATQGPVVVTVMDKDRVADYQRMAASLRNAGIKAEMFLGNPRQFGKQLQYADRRGAPIVVIQGSNERANGEVTLKDLIAGAEAAKSIADHKTWVEERPAQITVPETDLVERVKTMLAAQAQAAS